jgi:hypothetical protein
VGAVGPAPPSESEERRGAESRPGGGKASGTVAGVLRRASDAGSTCRGKAPRTDDGVSLDGGTAESALPDGLNGPLGTRASEGLASSAVRGRERRCSAASPRCGAPRLRGTPRASVERRPEAGDAASTAVFTSSSAPRRKARACRRKESSGSSGARSDGRLHSSVRGIFPSRRFRLQGREWPRRIARIGCSTRHGVSSFRVKRVLGRREEAEQRPRESPVRQRCRASPPKQGVLGRTGLAVLIRQRGSRPWHRGARVW